MNILVVIVIPILHTQLDMGSLLEQIRHAYITRYKNEKWTEHFKSIDHIWIGIHQVLAEHALPYVSINLYQDGQPPSLRETKEELQCLA